MKELFPHIFIEKNEDNRVTLVIEDYELFDFIEDYLTEECGISYEFRNSRKRVGGEIIRVTFPVSVKIQEIEKYIRRLSAEEVEKIYLQNNKPC